MSPPEPIAESPSVSTLLAQSREHAKQRTRLANRQSGKHHTPDYAQATEQAKLALEKRKQAHEIDPEHTDPSWALDGPHHEGIVNFLTRYIALP